MNNYHDNHYAEMEIQPLDVMQEIFDLKEMFAICISQVIKYHLRAGHKQGEAYEKDIAKRDRYLSWAYHNLCNGERERIDPKLDYQLDEEFKESILQQIDDKYKEMLAVK